MNIFLNEYFGFCFELNHFSARFNEKMNFQNVSNTPIFYPTSEFVKSNGRFVHPTSLKIQHQTIRKEKTISMFHLCCLKSALHKKRLLTQFTILTQRGEISSTCIICAIPKNNCRRYSLHSLYFSIREVEETKSLCLICLSLRLILHKKRLPTLLA